MACFIRSNFHWNIRSNAGVYFIPCKDCKWKYIGKNMRNIHEHIYIYIYIYISIRDIR